MNSVAESDEGIRELEIEVLETDKGEIPTLDGLKSAIEQIYTDFERLARPLEVMASEIEAIKERQETIKERQEAMARILQDLSERMEAKSTGEDHVEELKRIFSTELKQFNDILREKEKQQEDLFDQVLGLIKKISGSLVEYYRDLEEVKRKHEQDIIEARLLLSESIALLERTVNELRSYVLELMKAFLVDSKGDSMARLTISKGNKGIKDEKNL